MIPLRAAGVLACAVLLVASASGRPSAREVRGLWVKRTSLESPAAIAAMVAAAHSAGFNTLFVQVRGRGDAWFLSRIEPRAGGLTGQAPSFDPLAQVVRQGHAAGLRVHAWVNINLVADAGDVPKDPRHVVNRHPDWLMVPTELAASLANPRAQSFVPALAAWTRNQAGSVEGLFTSPMNAEAADHVVAVVQDLAARYAVDGVHLDYLRYPGPGFDCSQSALRAFQDDVSKSLRPADRRGLQRKARSNPLAWVRAYPGRWDEFRRASLTALVRRLRAAVKQKRPEAIVSAAVLPDPAMAAASRFQDWAGWMTQGLVDAACPMAYTTETDAFTQQIDAARTAARGRPIWAGIGAFRLDDDETLRQIAEARRLGVDGVILFSYDTLTSPARGEDSLSRIGAQAFGR